MRGANRIDRPLSCRLRQNRHMGVELLDRQIYSESDAAEILRVPTSTTPRDTALPSEFSFGRTRQRPG